MKKILLVDLCYFKGHHETYFIKILSTLVNNNYFVYASCSDNNKLTTNIEESKIINCQVVEVDLSFSDKVLRKSFLWLDKLISTFGFKLNIQFSSLSNLIATRRLLAQIGEKIPVFFAHADSIIPALPTQIASMFMPSKWIGLHVQPSYKAAIASGKEKSRKLFLAEKSFSLPSCKGVLFLHPLYKVFFNKRFQKINCIYLPEIIPDSFEEINKITEHQIINEIKEASLGREIISILGSLTHKKNLLLFLESFAKVNHNKFFAVVVGKLKGEQHSVEELSRIEELIKQLSESTYILLDYYIPNEEVFSNLLKVSNLIFLHYQDHPFSSNILNRSIALRKPVIASRGYLIEKTVQTYAWQAVTDDDPNQIARKMESVTANFKIDEEKFNCFLKEHSQETFETTILSACKELLAS